MSEIFELTSRPDPQLSITENDPNDPRLGDIVGTKENEYPTSDIVILGCPQDEGVRRYNGREGVELAPSAIRDQFYKLTTFNIKRKIFDLGDVKIGGTLEQTHDIQKAIVSRVLRDGKRLIVLGGGSDISYPDGCAMAEVYEPEWWIGVNVDSRLDVVIADRRHSGTAYRQLLDEGLLLPKYFFEVGFQSHYCSPVYYEYIRALKVHRISLELLRSRAEADLELKEGIKQAFIRHSSSLNTFFGFDLNVVRSADAPGTSAPSPLGIRAGEFIQLVKYAASLANTKIVEFSGVNPKFDADNRTTKLVAIAMHRFCTNVS